MKMLEHKEKFENLEDMDDQGSSNYYSIIMIEKFVEGTPELLKANSEEIAEWLVTKKILDYTTNHPMEIMGDILKVELRRSGEDNVDEQVENYQKLMYASKNPIDEPIIDDDVAKKDL